MNAPIFRAAATACVAIGVLALFPDSAYACPVCFDRDDEARLAFLATTGLLTLLPLGMVGGLAMWLRKRARGAGSAIPQRELREPSAKGGLGVRGRSSH